MAKREVDSDVKRIGDGILRQVRFILDETSHDDDNLRFKLNRWVYARLQLDEIRVKRPIKQALWDAGQTSCAECRKKFPTLKGVEIHRKNESLAYSAKNCVLLCRPCHQGMGK